MSDLDFPFKQHTTKYRDIRSIETYRLLHSRLLLYVNEQRFRLTYPAAKSTRVEERWDYSERQNNGRQ